MSEVNKAIRMAIDTGKVVVGSQRVAREAMLGKLKLIILASDCPERHRNDISHRAKLSGIPILTFDGPSSDLGIVCGKLFRVAALGIRHPGSSNILEISKSCLSRESE